MLGVCFGRRPEVALVAAFRVEPPPECPQRQDADRPLMAESTRSSLQPKAVHQCHSVTAFGGMSEMALSARSSRQAFGRERPA